MIRKCKNIKSIISIFSVIVLLLIGMRSGFCNNEIKVFVKDFGAIPDGQTINTDNIQKAIDYIADIPQGGVVVFTKGKWLCGSLILKSNVTLYIDEGAILLGSTDPIHYKKVEIFGTSVSPKTDDNSKLALILANNATNIGIKGRGTIDGQGRDLALTIDSLHHTGERIDPHYNKWRSRPSETARPKIINFSECKNVMVTDVTIKNSACWVQTYELCTNLIIDGLTVLSRAYWNNDGMDITDCKNVRISNCDVNSADDGICLKSYYPGHFNDSIIIENCTVRSSASAVKFGTASIGGFRNIIINNIRVIDTYRSAIAIETVDGGFIENVSVSNIIAKNTGNAIFIRLGHRSGAKPGTIKNISIKNVKVQVPFNQPDLYYELYGPALPFMHNPFPSPICGIPDNYIENIHLENIEISYPGRASKGMAYIPTWRLHAVPECIKDYPEFSMFGELPSWAFYVRHVKGITMKNIKLKLEKEDFRPAFIFDDVIDLNINDFQINSIGIKDDIILKNVQNDEIPCKERIKIVN